VTSLRKGMLEELPREFERYFSADTRSRSPDNDLLAGEPAASRGHRLFASVRLRTTREVIGLCTPDPVVPRWSSWRATGWSEFFPSVLPEELKSPAVVCSSALESEKRRTSSPKFIGQPKGSEFMILLYNFVSEGAHGAEEGPGRASGIHQPEGGIIYSESDL
jgi:hypothetical protein